MRSPRIGPKRKHHVPVPNRYPEMTINTEFDIDDATRDQESHFSPALVHNPIDNFTFNQSFSNQTRRKPNSQTSLFDFLPPQFQDRYGSTEDEIINNEWGESYRNKSHNTIRI